MENPQVEKWKRKLVKAQELVEKMAPKPPRKEKEAKKETMPTTEEEVAMKNIKCKDMHPLLSKTKLEAQTDF